MSLVHFGSRMCQLTQDSRYLLARNNNRNVFLGFRGVFVIAKIWAWGILWWHAEKSRNIRISYLIEQVWVQVTVDRHVSVPNTILCRKRGLERCYWCQLFQRIRSDPRHPLRCAVPWKMHNASVRTDTITRLKEPEQQSEELVKMDDSAQGKSGGIVPWAAYSLYERQASPACLQPRYCYVSLWFQAVCERGFSSWEGQRMCIVKLARVIWCATREARRIRDFRLGCNVKLC
jgi:hypothetical protein